MFKLTDAKKAKGEKSSSGNSIKRSSVRFIRKDLKVYLTNYRFFNSSPLKTKLIDISSRGVQITTTKMIRFKKKLSINIYFPDGFKFEISGKIVNHKKQESYLYNLKFDTIENYIDTQNVTIQRVYLFVSKDLINAKYRNITSNRVKILTNEKIDKKNELTLGIEFSNGKQIEKKATIIRHTSIIHHYYGIQFDKPNHQLGNYLLNTQKSLVFG